MLFKTLVILGLFACSQAVPTLSKSTSYISEVANELGFNLYKQVAENTGNVLVSPWSVHNVFALAYLGAEGNTAYEIAAALHLQNDKQEVARNFEEITHHFSSTTNSPVIFSNINRFYPALNVPIKEQYIQQAKQCFNVTVQPVNFVKANEAANKINKQIERNTDGKIKNLIQADMLGPMTRMVLINAIYFKGLWTYSFEKPAYQMNFYQHPSEVKKISSMRVHAKLPYRHNEDLDAQVVQLPYNDTDYSLVLIVPRSVDGIANVEKQLPIDMQQILSNTREIDVQLEMPKFSISQEIDLVGQMQKLGVHEPFKSSANFQAMTDEELYINNAIQKTHIEVNEEGTTAVASSNINLSTKSSDITVTANRPFIFVLYKKSVNLALLIGRFSNPNQWEQIYN